MTVDIPAVVVAALTAQHRPQTIDGLSHTRRTVRPVPVVPARHDERAGGAQRDIDLAASQRRNRTRPQRDRDRGAHADRQGSDPQAQTRYASTDGGGQRERVECRHLADPQPLQTRGAGGLGDFECLQVGPVQPQRQHRFDRRSHSMAASVVWPSRIRPGNSRDASFTWKCAVAVNASRKRRCSGAPS